MGSWIGGAFSDTGFNTGAFNTGVYRDDTQQGGVAGTESGKSWKFLHRDDNELLAIIIELVTSGILEE